MATRMRFNPLALDLFDSAAERAAAGPQPLEMWHPNLICTELTKSLFHDVPHIIKWYAWEARAQEGLRVYGVKQKRGRSYRLRDGQTIITIPQHAFLRGTEYKAYYIAHELAHFYDKNVHGHGPQFYVWFRDICPPELWHHELPYKPMEARAAGISVSSTANIITKWGKKNDIPVEGKPVTLW